MATEVFAKLHEQSLMHQKLQDNLDLLHGRRCSQCAIPQHIFFTEKTHTLVLLKQQQHITVVTRTSLDLGFQSFPDHRKASPSSLGCQEPEIMQIKRKACEILFALAG